jgi:hypothetical protein
VSRTSPLPVQILTVSHLRDSLHREALVYSAQPLEDETLADPVSVPITSTLLSSRIGEVREQLDRIIRATTLKTTADLGALAAATRDLSRAVLPTRGMTEVLRAGAQPQLSVIQDTAGRIPWETLEERFFVCSHHTPTLYSPWEGEPGETRYCHACGNPVEPAGGYLALRYHLTHLAHGSGRMGRAGRRFLVVEDPRQDLCTDQKDPDGACRRHLDEIRNSLMSMGYQLEVRCGPNARIKSVLSTLERPDVVGLYYFGHGSFPPGGHEGQLDLADGPLVASQLEEAAPQTRFVFLNACSGAEQSDTWDLERQSRSIASALARGSRNKVIIAPIWPVIAAQAAQMAARFFQGAAEGQTASAALQEARLASQDRFQRGHPDIGWMSYRYFGNPDRPLPKPRDLPAVAVGAGIDPQQLFESGELNVDEFSFPIAEVLLRSARRRNLEGRERIDVADLAFGLLRRGDLLRYLLRREGSDPDALYERALVAARERGAASGVDPKTVGLAFPSVGAAERPRDVLSRFLQRWTGRSRDQFTDEVAELLAGARPSTVPQARDHEDNRITERGVLQQLFGTRFRTSITHLGLDPEILSRAESAGPLPVDANGAIRLDGLDDEATMVVRRAHELAQQRGTFPITHRLFLAALASDPNGFLARRIDARYGEQDATAARLYELMINSTPQALPHTRGLNHEACGRIVGPVLETARQENPDHLIGARELFRSFCKVMDPSFGTALADPEGIGIDLELLGSDEMEVVRRLRFEPEAWSTLLLASQLADRQGHGEILTPHLFAAMLADETGPAARAVRRAGHSARELQPRVLGMVGRRKDAQRRARHFTLGRRAGQIVQGALRVSAQAQHERVRPTDLFEAFCADGGGVVGQMLRGIGVDLSPHPDSGGK